MPSHCRVLVTGAGSGVGQAIIKSLRISSLPIRIISTDISKMNAALYRADEAVLIPPVESLNALEVIVSIILSYSIDVVMIGSEFDLEFFSLHKAYIEAKSGAIVITSPIETIHLCNDKWKTAEYLRLNRLPYAESYLPANLEDACNCANDWGFPLVLKTRSGTSSRHVHIIRDIPDLTNRYPETPLPMLQRLLDMPSSDLTTEYTCSIFKTSDNSLIGPFTARRTVKGGTSWHVEVAPFESLYADLMNIANSLDYLGSLNIQLMNTPHGPIPFELNCRFSGTTAIRAHFGFNEPEMAIKSFFHKTPIAQPHIGSGLAIRYYEEVFIDNANLSTLSLSAESQVNRWF